MIKQSQQFGFTLLEVVITMAIFTVILESIYTTMAISQRALESYAQTTAPKEGLRAIVSAMTRELRGASNPFVRKNEHDITFGFQHPLYGQVKYSWTDNGTDAGKIIRSDSSKQSVVAYHITALDFSLPLTNNQVIIDISDGNPANGSAMELKQKVALRMQTGIY